MLAMWNASTSMNSEARAASRMHAKRGGRPDSAKKGAPSGAKKADQQRSVAATLFGDGASVKHQV